MEQKYYFAPSKLTYVKNTDQLAPAYCAEVGQTYHAFHWSPAKEDHFLAATAIYLGDGIWLDAETSEDVSVKFNWAAYLVKQK